MSSSLENVAHMDSLWLPSSLDTNDKDEEHRTTFFTGDDAPTSQELTHITYRSPSFWMISTFVLLVVVGFQSVLLLSGGQQMSPPRPSFSRTGETDFVSARSAIETEEIFFIGGPIVSSNGKMVVPHYDQRYIGEPRDELDEAWRNLTASTYIRITEAEAMTTWGDKYRQYWNEARGGYVAGLEMFHTLHCLNRLRMSLHSDYYQFRGYEHFNDENHEVHLNHCIQQIQQYIMCAGDMTPLPTRYSAVLDRNYVDSDTTHKCRNFDRLKQWSDERFNGKTEVPRYNRTTRG